MSRNDIIAVKSSLGDITVTSDLDPDYPGVNIYVSGRLVAVVEVQESTAEQRIVHIHTYEIDHNEPVAHLYHLPPASE